MAETHNQKTPPTDSQSEDEKAPSRLQNFVNNHPRAAKVVAVTGAATAAIGLVHITRTVKARKEHLVAAGEKAGEALSEVAASVSPTDEPKA